jgi:hypothetical protein
MAYAADRTLVEGTPMVTAPKDRLAGELFPEACVDYGEWADLKEECR